MRLSTPKVNSVLTMPTFFGSEGQHTDTLHHFLLSKLCGGATSKRSLPASASVWSIWQSKPRLVTQNTVQPHILSGERQHAYFPHIKENVQFTPCTLWLLWTIFIQKECCVSLGKLSLRGEGEVTWPKRNKTYTWAKMRTWSLPFSLGWEI